MMKKLLTALLLMLSMVLCLTGCGGSSLSAAKDNLRSTIESYIPSPLKKFLPISTKKEGNWVKGVENKEWVYYWNPNSVEMKENPISRLYFKAKAVSKSADMVKYEDIYIDGTNYVIITYRKVTNKAGDKVIEEGNMRMLSPLHGGLEPMCLAVTSYYRKNKDRASSSANRTANAPAISMDAIDSTSESSLDNENGYKHSAALTIDGNVASCWTEGVDGLGAGENVSYYFDGTYKVSGLNIWIGHQKSEHLFYANARPKTIRVEGSNGFSQTFSLEDTMGKQRCNFSSPIDTKFIRITVLNARAGSEYRDTCIAEVSFF